MRIQILLKCSHFHKWIICAFVMFFCLDLPLQAQEPSLRKSANLLFSEKTSPNDIDNYLYQISDLFDINADSAHYHIKNFIELASQSKQTYALAEAYNFQGLFFLYQAEFNSAITSYMQAKQVSENEINEGNDMQGSYRRALQGLGAAHEELGKTRVALDFYFEVLEVSQKKQDTLSIADTYNNIGSVYLGINDNKEASLNFEKAISLMKGKEDDPNFPIYLSNLGHAYENRNEFNQAFVKYREALRLDSLQQNDYGLAYDYFSIGELSKKMELLDQSFNAFKKALSLSASTGDLLLNSRVKRNLAELYLDRQQPDSALNLANQAYQQSIEVGNPEVKKESARILATLYEQQGQISLANTLLREYVSLSEEIINQEKIKAITRMESEFNFDREREQTKLVQQRTYAALILFVLLLVATGYFLVDKSRNNKQLVQLSEELSYLNQNLEKEVATRTKDLQHRTDQLEELAYINSHSLRASLSQIIGLSKLLENLEIMEVEEQQGLINHIHTASMRMDETVRSMDEKISVNRSESEETEA